LNFIPNAYQAFAFQVPLFWVLFSLSPCTLHHGFYVPTSKESTWGSLVGLGGLEKQLWFIVCRCAKLVQRFFEKETKKYTSNPSLLDFMSTMNMYMCFTSYQNKRVIIMFDFQYCAT
jgi:hypothetical protein